MDGNEGPEGALIEVSDSKGRVIKKTTTEKGGYFTIERLDVGEYKISLL